METSPSPSSPAAADALMVNVGSAISLTPLLRALCAVASVEWPDGALAWLRLLRLPSRPPPPTPLPERSGADVPVLELLSFARECITKMLTMPVKGSVGVLGKRNHHSPHPPHRHAHTHTHTTHYTQYPKRLYVPPTSSKRRASTPRKRYGHLYILYVKNASRMTTVRMVSGQIASKNALIRRK